MNSGFDTGYVFSDQLTLFIKHFLSNDNFQRENENTEVEAFYSNTSPRSSATKCSLSCCSLQIKGFRQNQKEFVVTYYGLNKASFIIS